MWCVTRNGGDGKPQKLSDSLVTPQSIEPVVLIQVLVKMEVFLHTCLMQGIEDNFLLGRRKDGITIATLEIGRASEMNNER